MPEVLVLEFPGVTEAQYRALHQLLDLDQAGWPGGLHSQLGATSETGLLVVEVWESQDAQLDFLNRCAPAFGAAGLPQPSRMEWLSLAGQFHP